MPSDDVILNLKQIAGYSSAPTVQGGDTVVVQRGGLGGPYYSMSIEELVGGALAGGGDMTVAGSLGVQSIQVGSLQGSNATFGWLTASNAALANLNITAGWLNGEALATQSFVGATTVSSFNFRRGDVVLDIADLLTAGGAPIFSPAFQGAPTAPTPLSSDNSNMIATTAFVQQAIGGYLNYWVQTQPLVFTFNGRTGDVTLEASDFTTAGLAPLASPAFTGVPTAPTAPPLTDNTQIATTAYVDNAITNINTSHLAPIDSPAFTGYATAPTPPSGTSDGQIATTAFVMNAVSAATAGVSSFNGRTGAVTLVAADITGAGGAVLASPIFSGVPQAPTAAPGTNTQQIATTAYVMAALGGGGVVTSFNTRTGAITLSTSDITSAGGAPVASPALTGTPTAPTAGAGDNSTTLATTAFVHNQIAAIGTVVQSFNGRSGAVTLAANDISAAGGAVLASPSFSGTPTAPTANPGTATGQLATTAFVMNALASGAGVSSFNSRTGAVVLTTADITGAGGAPTASPTFTGTPAVPTAAPGTNTTQAASTAFVTAALTSGAVSSFNTRTGAVTLQGSDITGAGGALLASPGLTGVPTAPTAATATNTTQIATTAFVQAAISAGAAGVISFNSRTGAVTLQANDLSAVGGALLASPAFTGSPTAPTPAAADNSTNIATTAFVKTALSTAGGVTTFNGRAGAVTLTTADITGAGGLPAANPTFTGTMSGPTLGLTGNLNVSGQATFSGVGVQQTQIRGDQSGANMAAGYWGEIVANAANSTGYAYNVAALITSITVQAGDWEVWGHVYISMSGAASPGMNAITADLSTINNGYNQQYGPSVSLNVNGGFTLNSGVAFPVTRRRFLVTAATTIYLVMAVYGSGGGTITGSGIVTARRIR